MNKWLRRLPGYQAYEPGLEHKVLHELPEFVVFASLVLSLPSLLARIFLSAKVQRVIDILVIGAEIFFLGMMLTLAITALMVMFSKGSVYAAHGYPLIDTDETVE